MGRFRSGLVLVVSAAVTVGVMPALPAVATPVAVPPAATEVAAPGAPAADVLVDGWGDAAGYHLTVGTGAGSYQPREVAVLRPGGRDSASWTGYQCVSGDGRYVAVAVLPTDLVNRAAARDSGAVAYAVDLRAGTVRPVATGVGLKYHSPGCGTGSQAVFTLNTGADQQVTRALTVELPTGAIRSVTTVAGQVTSVVPTAAGPVGVRGAALVRLPARGSARTAATRLATLPGAGFDVRPTADGGVDLLTAGSDPTVTLWHAPAAGPMVRLGSGPAASTRLFAGRAGRPVAVGVTGLPAGTGVVAVPAPARGTGASSLDGRIAVGADTGTVPVLLDTTTGARLDRPRPAPALRAVPVVPPLVPATDGPVRAPTTHAPAGTRGPAGSAGSAGLPGAQPNVAGTPTCAVPRLAENRQVLQPWPAQIDWAAQMAEQGLLTGSLARPANYANLGLASYAANTDFPRIALHHPAADSWDTVPRSVYEAIMAQESNWSQASWHALPGLAGGPLISDYYGAGGGISTIDYPNADCGYGIGQVTTGMTTAETVYSPNGKTKIAVDYEENIAAGLQILQSTWNQLYDAGIKANDGSPRYLENWYFAAWAYNTGIQPTAKYGNTTGCTPGPTCLGPDGTWGLGWTNNPKNPDYPPTRAPYLRDTYADAAHPASWPYQERVMGWMGSPLIRLSQPAYAGPTYHGGSTWLQIPAVGAMCSTDNRCDPAYQNGAASYCTLADFECWWHLPVTWVASCTTTCATSAYAVGAGSTEPAGSADPHPPTCSLDTTKVPTTASGPPIIVDESQSQPPLNRVGCGASNWSQGGTFSYAYGTNANGDPVGAIDTHQLGTGFGGHILFTHTESGSDPNLVNTGTWTPTLPKLQYYKIKLHLPGTGASATDVVYNVYPGGGVAPWKIRVNQHWESEQWVTIGTFAMQAGGYVTLSNTSTDTAYGDAAYSDYDVAFDAVAFVQMGGTPGQPIGGPPGVIDAPKGSNPAWVQCGCVRRTAGDPVDTSTGYYGDTFTDLATPGRGAPLHFTRTYASALADPAGPNGANAVNGPFGWGWTFSYNLSAATTASVVTIKQEDGSQVPFAVSGTTYTPAAPRYDATLTKSGSTYTYTRRSSAVFTFDVATGRLLSETDVAGTRATPAYATTLAYDGSGHLSTITDPASRVYTLTWTGTHVTKLVDTAGHTVTYGYDAAGNLTDVLGVGTTRTPTLLNDDHTVFGYTTAHLLNSYRRPTAYGSAATPTPVTSMVYDTAERVTSQTDPMGHTTTFTYAPNGALAAGQVRITDPAGHKTVDTYANGLLTAETRGEGTSDAGTWTYTYDPVSLGVTSSTDPNGRFRTFTYDDHGNRTSASDARGYVTSSTYDDQDRLTSTIDPTGLQTVHGWDQAGHIKTPTGTNDGTVSYNLPTSATVQKLGQDADVPDGNPPASVVRTANLYYDDAAHPADLTRALNGRGFTTTSTYDSAGDQLTVLDAENHTTKYGYDTARGWRTSTVSPVGVAAGVLPTCTPPAKGCTTYGYDAWGGLIRTTDPLNHVTRAVFDADGNQTSSTDANNRTTGYTYDFADRQTVVTRADTTTEKTTWNPDGSRLSTVDGLSHASTYGYDNQGRRTTRTDAAGRITRWAFDHAGQLLTSTDAGNRVTTYGHDAAGHQTTVSHSDGVTPNVTATVYDGAGRRTSITDGSGTSTWSYDTFGEVTGSTDGAGATVGYGYDADGDVTTISYPGGAGRTVTRGFDKTGNLTSIKDWSNRTTAFGYDPDGDLATETAPNGTVTTRTFDDADELTATTLKKGATTLATLTSPRDPAGQLAGETPTGVPGSAQTYAYTPLEQLKTATVGSTPTPYAFDAADDPTTVGAATQSFDTTDRLCWSTTAAPPPTPTCAAPPAGATTYTVDPQGDRTKATTGAAVTTYGYDQESRLTSYGKTGTAATYSYDGSGQRTAKTVNGTTTRFTWSTAGNLLWDGTTAYLYGPAGPVAQIGASTQWFLADQLGSTRALVDTTGAITGGYGYTPWGTVSAHTGTAATPLQFTGQYADAESGLLYLRARYYDPVTAQFLTVDPALDLTGDRYGYVGGNPLNDTDPTGLCGLKCKLLLAAGAATVAGTVACVWLEPCGIAVAGGIVLGEGLAVATGVTITVTGAGTAATAAAAGATAGLAAGTVWSTASGGGGSGTSGRDVHGKLADPDVDVTKVCEEGDLYYQDDGQLVRVLDNGNGTSDVVIRDPSNPSSESTTKMKGVKNSYVQSKIDSGRWWD